MRCVECKTIYDAVRQPVCPCCRILSPKVVGSEGLRPGNYDLMLGEDGRFYVIGEHGKLKH